METNSTVEMQGAVIVGSGVLLGINELDDLIKSVEWDGCDPDKRSRKEISQLLECARELKIWRTNGVTEELLRRHDGYIKVGKGCVVALESMMPNRYCLEILRPITTACCRLYHCICPLSRLLTLV